MQLTSGHPGIRDLVSNFISTSKSPKRQGKSHCATFLPTRAWGHDFFHAKKKKRKDDWDSILQTYSASTPRPIKCLSFSAGVVVFWLAHMWGPTSIQPEYSYVCDIRRLRNGLGPHAIQNSARTHRFLWDAKAAHFANVTRINVKCCHR